MNFIRSIIFNIVYILWTPLSGLAFLPIALIFRGRRLQRLFPSIWGGGLMFFARIILGIRYEIRGKENMVTDGPAIYAVKHQSAWETIVFWTLVKTPVYVLKKELLKIPVFGQYLQFLVHTIAVDRSAGMAALKSLISQSREHLDAGRQIVIFPEGTRKKVGAKPDYQAGITAMYGKLNSQVIPVALNSGLLWGKDAFIKKPGTIVIEFLPAIPAGLPKKEFATRLQDDIETASNRLCGL